MVPHSAGTRASISQTTAMHPTLARSKRFEDLLALQSNDTPYAFDSIFRNDGWSARRLSMRKYKVLKRIDTRLRSVLEDGERVRFLTLGSSVTFWESYFLGMMGHLLNYRAMAFTDRRILLVQLDWRERPRELMEQIRWPSLASMRRSGMGKLQLVMDDGSKLAFQGTPRADRKLLQELGEKMAGLMQGDGTGREHLCPHCFAVAEKTAERCAVCKGAFKRPGIAFFRSLLFPGLGDWYLGHRKIAVWEMLVAAVIWFAVFYPDPAYPITPGYAAFVAGFVLLFIHLPDAIATRYVARKGLYPDGGRIGARVPMRRRAEAQATQRVTQ